MLCVLSYRGRVKNIDLILYLYYKSVKCLFWLSIVYCTKVTIQRYNEYTLRTNEEKASWPCVH